MKYNILYIDSSEIYGGGQISLLELLKRINRTKFNPIVVLPTYAERLKIEVEQIGLKYEIISMPKIRPFNFFTFIKSIRSLRNIIREDRIALVHANTSRAAVYVLLAAGKVGVPVIWHARIPHRDIFLDWFLGLRCSQIITVSQAVKKRFNWHRKSKVEVICNGVDIDRFSLETGQENMRKNFCIDPDAIIVGSVGRISPEKGYEFLISAVRGVIKLYPQTKLLIAGEGDNKYRCYLQKKINDFELQPHVIFTGFCEDVLKVLKCVDIFCLPSLTEGFSRSLLEAMACGLPVVATNVGGNVEIVQDRSNGLLVQPGDSDMLASAIMELLKDREEAKKMGLEGRRLIMKRFSIERNVRRTEELYEKIISNYHRE